MKSTKRRIIVAPPSSHNPAVPPTPATPRSPSRRLEEARTPPTVSPFLATTAMMTPPTPPPTITTTTTITTTVTTKQKKQWTQVYTQVYLDCGQSAFGQQLCQKCGMLYMPGVAEDMKAHAVICKERRLGVSWRPSSAQRVHWNSSKNKHKSNRRDDGDGDGDGDGDSIMIVSVVIPLSGRKKAVSGTLESVYRLVAQDLGMDSTSLTVTESIAGYTVWLYLRQQRVVGFVATKPISEAFRLASTSTTPSAANTDANDDANDDEQATTTSTTLDHLSTTGSHRIPHKAMMGVAILWTHERFRGQGIATQLVDTARQATIGGGGGGPLIYENRPHSS
jgi:ribosomal protein S18 acetylase RimI-like enzyme